jgi:putative membrane protein
MLTNAVLTELAAHPGWGWGGGPGWLFLLIPLFWIALFAILFAIFGRRWRRGWNGQGPYPYGQTDARSAESTLAERFARGDIEEVEYRARLEVLRANRPAGPPAR